MRPNARSNSPSGGKAKGKPFSGLAISPKAISQSTPATGPDMNRRLLLLLPFALLVSGEDTPQPIFDLLVNAASELSAGNARGFLDLFDKDMPGLDDLRRNVTA